jgi:putative hemolysin
MAVYYARSRQIPSLLREIGRLREISFREVGEGSGKARDLDRFDEYYLHLFVWDHDQQRLVGAYRLGRTDSILRRHGIEGLYTSTLFRFGADLLGQVGPCIEMGRSFVRTEYQKQFTPLMLLWTGIAHYAAAHPRYRCLFGPVSISNDYHSVSKQLLVSFLRTNRFLPDLARMVAPRHPPGSALRSDQDTTLVATCVHRIEDVDELVREVEMDRRNMPVLLRQYLRLNGKLLGFNIDPQFGDVLDGLILVDLTQVERAILQRYMGRENVAKFLTHHGKGLGACDLGLGERMLA